MSGINSYGRQYIDQSDIDAVTETLKSDWLTQGPACSEFEKTVAAYHRASHGVLVSNGTAALFILAQALGLKPGNEVIVTSITFAASANAVKYCGADVIFADIDPVTWNISPASVKNLITDKTVGIIAVDLAGQMCDLDALGEIAEEHNLWIIEDAAHAVGSFGSFKTGRHAPGTHPAVSAATFSFHPVKTITTGEGGMIITNDKTLAEKCALLRSHGITRDTDLLEQNDGPWYYEMLEFSGNYRLPDINAALGLSQFKKLDSFKEKRRALFLMYKDILADIDGITAPVEIQGRESCWHLFVIRWQMERITLSKQELFAEVRNRGIGINLHYIPTYRMPFYRKNMQSLPKCPEAEKYYKEAMTIPLHCNMNEDDVKYVTDSLKDIVNKHS